MALTHSSGTRIEIIRGDYKGKKGTVQAQGKIKVVLLDGGTELMGVSDSICRKL
jgi:hypothetical protein